MDDSRRKTSLNGDYRPTKSEPDLTDAVFLLFTRVAHFVLRTYLACILYVWDWGVGLVHNSVKPFDQVTEEVRKVPKKDVSASGIFYQCLRLMFLVVLYLAPFAGRVFSYVTRPLVSLREWMEDYVNQGKSSSPVPDSKKHES